MKSTPILFNEAMVCAILNGNKTQTRRIVKLKGNDGIQSDHDLWRYLDVDSMSGNQIASNKEGMFFWQHKENIIRLIQEQCPYGTVGDSIWVKETWRTWESLDHVKPSNLEDGVIIDYAAGGNSVGAFLVCDVSKKWRSPLFMQKRFSRITLQITNVRIERLNDISEHDALAEGVDGDFANYKDYSGDIEGFAYATGSYRTLWESMNGAGSWAANPWVWVIEFEVLK